jgi:hypothetical protein
MAEYEIVEFDEGKIVDPPSDTKQTFVPSPPSMVDVKINPRPSMIVFGGEPSDIDAAGTYAVANKIVLVIPSSTDNDTLVSVIKYLSDNAKGLNVTDEYHVSALPGAEAEASAFASYYAEEYGTDITDDGTLEL